jgi:hypothetical protein
MLVLHTCILFRHAAAFLGAAPARFRTFPAMLHVVGVLFALGGALLADFGAQPAKAVGMGTAEAHQFRCRPANGGAFQIHVDALRLVLNVRLVQAGNGAVAANDGAFVAGFDAALKFLM